MELIFIILGIALCILLEHHNSALSENALTILAVITLFTGLAYIPVRFIDVPFTIIVAEMLFTSVAFLIGFVGFSTVVKLFQLRFKR